MNKMKNTKLYCHEFAFDPEDGWLMQDLCYRLRDFLTKKFGLQHKDYRDAGTSSGICIVHENEDKINEVGKYLSYLLDSKTLEKLINTYFVEDVQYNQQNFMQDLELAYKASKLLELNNEISSELAVKPEENKRKIKV